MKGKFIIGFIVIFILILIGLQQYFIWNNTSTDDVLLNKIEKLELKLDSLNNKKDSIRIAIDSTHVKIITNEKRYQERVNTIITQPDSFSESFTRQYLRDYASTRGYCIIGTSEIE